MTSVTDITAGLWNEAGGNSDALDRLSLSGIEPGLPSSFRIGAAAQAAIAAAGLAAAEMQTLRTGTKPNVSVEMGHAVAEFLSERLLRMDGQRIAGFRDQLAGIYPTAGGGWFRPHITFPHHKQILLNILGLSPDADRDSFAAAIREWQAEDLERETYEGGASASALRTFEQWDRHPQALSVESEPLIEIRRIGNAEPRPLRGQAVRPLSGVRVLDLTRVIAGPVCGRSFASYGADVLAISAPHLPWIRELVLDTNRGKWSAHLDLDTLEGTDRLRELACDADIFLQSYRPGALERRGFGASELAAISPGIIHVSLSAYGFSGPWADRRGFDSLVQTATGFNHAEAEAAGSQVPLELPCQVLDHASGHLMALGAMSALARREREGGSWAVRVSLARTAKWLRSLGRIQNGFASSPAPIKDEYFGTCPSQFGKMTYVRPAATLSNSSTYLPRPTVSLGSDPAAWPT